MRGPSDYLCLWSQVSFWDCLQPRDRFCQATSFRFLQTSNSKLCPLRIWYIQAQCSCLVSGLCHVLPKRHLATTNHSTQTHFNPFVLTSSRVFCLMFRYRSAIATCSYFKSVCTSSVPCFTYFSLLFLACCLPPALFCTMHLLFLSSKKNITEVGLLVTQLLQISQALELRHRWPLHQLIILKGRGYGIAEGLLEWGLVTVVELTH